MTIIELVTKEFEQIFPSILKNGRVELSIEDLFDAPNSYIIGELNHLKGIVGIDENERESLLEFIVLMEQAEEPVEFDELICKKLNSYIQKYSTIKSFEFFYFRYQLYHYLDGGINIDTICDIYQDIVDSELLYVEDFCQYTNFHLPVITLVAPTDCLISVFHRAVQTFPKSILKYILGRLYENSDIGNALKFNLLFLQQIDSERIFNNSNGTYEFIGDSITKEEFDITLSTIAELYFKDSQYELALEYCERCLVEYKKVTEDIYSFQTMFLNPLTVKLRIHIKQGNIDDFQKDYQLLRSKVDDIDFAEMNIDDIKEFAKGLKM